MPHHTELIAILTVGFVLAYARGLAAHRRRLAPLVGYLVAGLAAFAGAWLGIRLIRALTVHMGLDIFAYYCWGAALLAFILYLSV